MKLVCTVGPVCCSFEQLEALAMGGMNVARINMCHGTRDWHQNVIRNVRKLNQEKGYAVAIMMDIEGSEIHMGDLGGGVVSVKAEIYEDHGREEYATRPNYGQRCTLRTIQLIL
ncbi:hypothetical protein KI387_042067 [Taxus chinensis]|uniref:pyruvate kinase n=1 Tax=Taxus chinensis TaxID=29808 RepID=A0AA38C262_TAXCH|nr:hypothetical protein KI387_042067 [Taxus chinensis]